MKRLGKVTHIVLHYSATYADQDLTAKDIDAMHKARGWKMIGYHYVIRRGGMIEKGREENELGAHVGGQNSGKIGICCIGGLDRATGPNVGVDNRTPEQIKATVWLVKDLLKRYPGAQVVGPRDLAPTQVGTVDDVVVQQGGGVDEFDRGGQFDRDVDRAPGPRGSGGGQGQQGPQTLAAGRDQMFGQQGDDRDLRLHPLDDHGVDGRHVSRSQLHQRLDAALGSGIGDGDSVQGETLRRDGAGKESRLKIQPPPCPTTMRRTMVIGP